MLSHSFFPSRVIVLYLLPVFVLIIFYQATEPLSVPIPNRLNHLYIVFGYLSIESQNTQNLGIYRILGGSFVDCLEGVGGSCKSTTVNYKVQAI